MSRNQMSPKCVKNALFCPTTKFQNKFWKFSGTLSQKLKKSVFRNAPQNRNIFLFIKIATNKFKTMIQLPKKTNTKGKSGKKATPTIIIFQSIKKSICFFFDRFVFFVLFLFWNKHLTKAYHFWNLKKHCFKCCDLRCLRVGMKLARVNKRFEII